MKRSKEEIVDKVRRLLSRNEQMTPTEIACKLCIPASYAHKLRVQVLAKVPV